MWLFAFLVAAGMTALNLVLWLNHHEAISLGAMVFSGAVAVFDLVMAAKN